MTPAVADITEPIPAVPGDACYPTRVLFMPVFVDGGDRRRRMVVRGRYLAATACLAYLVMLGVSITASPVSKPAGGAPGAPGPGVVATTSPKALSAEPRVDTRSTKVLADGDAAQDALVLRLALSAPRHPAQPRLPPTTKSAPAAPFTARRRSDDDHKASQARPISATGVVSSVLAPATATATRAAR